MPPVTALDPVHRLMPEVPVMLTDRTQRWQSGQHSFVRTSAGGFDPNRYEVHPFTGDREPKRFVEAHHYSGTFVAARFSYGLYLVGDPDPLVGVAVFSVPVNTRVITSVFPDLDLRTGVELGRLVLEGPVAAAGGPQRAPANAESWFIARCFEDLVRRGVRGVVSFADPVPRTRHDGTIVLPGHVGITYQALNLTYTGRGTARYVTLLGDGRTISDRALQKIRTGEVGHEYVERRLIALGATTPRAGTDMGDWLTGALNDVGARRLKHGGNHRFVIALGATRRERRDVRIAMDALPFPKTPDLAPSQPGRAA